jgi:hypothetical protein
VDISSREASAEIDTEDDPDCCSSCASSYWKQQTSPAVERMNTKGKTPSLIVTANTFDEAKMHLHERVEDKLLAAALLRLYYAQFSAKEKYYAGLAPAGAIVPITADQWKNWRDEKHADANAFIIEKVEDVETILVTDRVKLPRTSANDKKNI